MKKIFLAIVLSGFGIFTISAFVNKSEMPKPVLQQTTATVDNETIQWMTFAEAVELNTKKKTQKKIFIDVYTDWCGWCKKMDSGTFTDPKVIKYMNENYHAVKFDAEQKEPIDYNGTTYNFVASGSRGYHELAGYLLNGRLSYPTTVYMDEENALIQALPGYKDPATLEIVLAFFGSDSYETITWDQFVADFQNQNVAE